MSASTATTTLWYPRAALPYLSVLYAERVVLRQPLASIRMWCTVYFGPSLPIVMWPSHSETDRRSMRLRIWLKLGTRNLPSAFFLSIPSSWRSFAPVAALYMAIALNTSSLKTYGRPFLPSFFSSTPPNSVSAVISST